MEQYLVMVQAIALCEWQGSAAKPVTYLGTEIKNVNN